MRLINKFIIILAKLIKISIKSATNVHKLLKLRISSEKAKIKKNEGDKTSTILLL